MGRQKIDSNIKSVCFRTINDRPYYDVTTKILYWSTSSHRRRKVTGRAHSHSDIFVYAGSFHHSVVPLPLGGRLGICVPSKHRTIVSLANNDHFQGRPPMSLPPNIQGIIAREPPSKREGDHGVVEGACVTNGNTLLKGCHQNIKF